MTNGLSWATRRACYPSSAQDLRSRQCPATSTPAISSGATSRTATWLAAGESNKQWPTALHNQEVLWSHGNQYLSANPFSCAVKLRRRLSYFSFFSSINFPWKAFVWVRDCNSWNRSTCPRYGASVGLTVLRQIKACRAFETLKNKACRAFETLKILMYHWLYYKHVFF